MTALRVAAGFVLGAFLGVSLAAAGGLWWPGMVAAGAVFGAFALPWAARHPDLR